MPTKTRTAIPDEVAALVLFQSDRVCCVCRLRKPVQIHHIDENPANHQSDNLAVLCLDCHRETQIRGGFDRKLDAHQIALYRADWLAAVAKQRAVQPGGELLPSVASSNVLPIRPWHSHVRLGPRNIAFEDATGPFAALIAPFRNDPTPQRPHVGPATQLVATITMDASPDFPITGHWLGSGSQSVSLPAGEQRMLVVAVISTTAASILSDLRFGRSGEVEFKHFLLKPTTVNETDLSISCSSEGRLLCTQRYHIKVWPFPDIRFA